MTYETGSLLCNPDNFAFRIRVEDSALPQIKSIARRVYRFFAHAFFHHPDAFRDFEVICSHWLSQWLLFALRLPPSNYARD